MANSWFVYLIECDNGRLYTGITVDLRERFEKHRLGQGAMFTRLNPPSRMIAAKPLANRSQASKAEHEVKKLTATQKRQLSLSWPLREGLPRVMRRRSAKRG